MELAVASIVLFAEGDAAALTPVGHPFNMVS